MTAAMGQSEPDRTLDEPLAHFDPEGAGVAFVGPDVPVDVLLAGGRPFGHLPWRPDGQTDWADQWLESSFPFWARSILEQWHDGEFDRLATVVFSRADDASQRLYYYVRELKRRGKLAGPPVQIFDIALIPSASSLAHTESAVAGLLQWLDLNETSLEAGIERANRLRERIAAIETARSADGPAYERVARAALWSDPTQWLDDVARPLPVTGRPRILLAGSMPVDARIHEAVELVGASIVSEAHALAPCRLGPALAVTGESPARAVARHLRRHSVSPRAFLDRAGWLVARARAVRAAAVILWLTREDEGLVWAVPSQRDALTAAGIPTLVLPASRWQADDDTLEKIMAFCRGFADAAD